MRSPSHRYADIGSAAIHSGGAHDGGNADGHSNSDWPAWTSEQQAAADTVQRWYQIYNEAMRGERGAGDFVLAGRGKVVSEAGRTFNEFGLAELTAEGEILISALAPAKAAAKERLTVLVDLCEDTRGWRVLDKDGNDALSLESKVIRPLVATVEEWPSDGWYVTSITGGKQSC